MAVAKPHLSILLSVVCLGTLPTALGAKGGEAFPPSTPFDIDELFSGPLDDAVCNIEAVDSVNNAQLACILSDLADTTFFRLFPVDLGRECPFFNKKGKKGKNNDTNAAEPETCSSTGPPEALPFGGAAARPPPFFGGGGGEAAEPACSVAPEAKPKITLPFTKETDQVDQSLSNREGKVLLEAYNDSMQPSFWLDLCDGIGVAGESATMVNLRKNPERWTGYNGSEVWGAIYNENCFAIYSSEGDDELCYEERVLYKLLSALHTSINVHIAMNHYPPRKGIRSSWEPNPSHFIERYSSHPERIKNLHFGFVVLLRAIRKAGPHLLTLNYRTDPNASDSSGEGTGMHTRALVRRLLQTEILTSCNEVFRAFDETLLFQSTRDGTPVAELKRDFKNVFRNISRILDCVSCQKCKLHGKLALLGLGAALKTLLLPSDMIAEGLTKFEIVALINTLGKFSKAIQGARDLTEMHRANIASLRKAVGKKNDPTNTPTQRRAKSAIHIETTSAARLAGTLELADKAVGITASAKDLAPEDEDALIDAILRFDPRPLILAKHYGKDAARFTRHALRVIAQPLVLGEFIEGQGSGGYVAKRQPDYDLAVIGGGLTGLTAALMVLDQGGKVALLEKEPFLGGNSAWASSGVNAAPLDHDGVDSTEIFASDTLRSGGGNAELVEALVKGSMESVKWLEKRLDIDLDQISQLGGHSVPRTRRSEGGMVGQELVLRISREVKKFAGPGGPLTLLTRTTAKALFPDGGDGEAGVEYLTSSKTDGVTSGTIKARLVAVTTGGYANDRDDGGLLYASRPDLKGLPTTNGRWATGDGIKLARGIGGGVVDLDQVQVHPTAFIDPKKPKARRKTLCAELLRGVGGVLLTRDTGARFVDELAPRDHVVAAMREASGGRAGEGFIILLSEKMAQVAKKHTDHYLQKGLLQSFRTLRDVATWAKLPKKALQNTIAQYNAVAEQREEESEPKQFSGSEPKQFSGPFGKEFFHNVPINSAGGFLAGIVVPAVHYTMGGLSVSPNATILSTQGAPLPGLLAGGEVVGGMHGKNRLGGNALTECVVFGRIIGSRALGAMEDAAAAAVSTGGLGTDISSIPGETIGGSSSAELKAVSLAELGEHNTTESCWVGLYGKVYDLTDFLSEHPAGPEAILEVGGRDGTEEFEAIHSKAMLDDFEPIGTLLES